MVELPAAKLKRLCVENQPTVEGKLIISSQQNEESNCQFHKQP